jgi:hypothetical protein
MLVLKYKALIFEGFFISYLAEPLQVLFNIGIK